MNDDAKNSNTSSGKEVEDKGMSLMPSHEDLMKALNQDEVIDEESESKSKDEKTNVEKESDGFDEAKENVGEDKYSAAEEKALEMGWLPEKEFNGPLERWRDAATFVDRMQMMKKIGGLEGEIRESKIANQKMTKLFEKMIAKESKKEAQQILEKKHNAIAEGDIEEAERFEREYYEKKQEVSEIKETNIPSVAIQKFIDKNQSWYNRNTEENREMVAYANRLDDEYLKNPEYKIMSEEKRLDAVERVVKRVFSERFANPNRSKAVAVEGRGRPSGAKASPASKTFKDLPFEHQQIIENLKKSGLKMTKDEYAKSLFERGVI